MTRHVELINAFNFTTNPDDFFRIKTHFYKVYNNLLNLHT
jgi:hypothetical protein